VLVLKGLKKLGVMVFRAIEHQVFKQVGKPGFPLGLILRADVVPDTDGDNGGFTILMDDDGQSIVQGELIKGYVNLCHVGI
jgi:hypothetical protein